MTDVKNPIQVTILGSGTCVPSLRRSSCSVLMETGGKKLLFDAGAGTLRLTHFYPRCDLFDIEKECRKTYNKEFVLAEDLLRL